MAMGISTMAGKEKGDDNRLYVLPLYLPRDVGAVALSFLQIQQYRAVLNHPGLFLPLLLLLGDSRFGSLTFKSG